MGRVVRGDMIRKSGVEIIRERCSPRLRRRNGAAKKQPAQVPAHRSGRTPLRAEEADTEEDVSLPLVCYIKRRSKRNGGSATAARPTGGERAGEATSRARPADEHAEHSTSTVEIRTAPETSLRRATQEDWSDSSTVCDRSAQELLSLVDVLLPREPAPAKRLRRRTERLALRSTLAFCQWKCTPGFTHSHLRILTSYEHYLEARRRHCTKYWRKTSSATAVLNKLGLFLKSSACTYFRIPRRIACNAASLMQGPLFTRISSNRYAPGRRPRPRTAEDSLCQSCDCSLEQGCKTEDCINRAIHIECDKRSCPVAQANGGVCGNMRLRRKQKKKIAVRKTPLMGYGAFAREEIKEGDFVIEYVGEVIGSAESQQRLERSRLQKKHDFYMMMVDKETIIDATLCGNESRFINHSCEPNLETQRWIVNDLPRVGLYALRDIQKGESLSYDYDFEWFSEPQLCLCGAKSCKGIIGRQARK